MAAFMAVAALLYFWDPLFTWPAGNWLAGGDITAMFIPGKISSWIRCGLRVASCPCGTLPVLGRALCGQSPAHGVLSVHLPGAADAPDARHGADVGGARMAGGMGCNGWLRSLGASHAGAFLAGVAFGFTGTFAARVGAGHYGIALQLAWWPLSAWALQSAFERRSWRWAILGGAPLALACCQATRPPACCCT